MRRSRFTEEQIIREGARGRDAGLGPVWQARGQRRQRNRPAAANDNATTGALPAPRTMADVVNNVDQSRQMQQTVTVNHSVTVNATTNATPAAIGTLRWALPSAVQGAR